MKKAVIVLVLIVLAFLFFREAYYRGVYDTCVRSCVVNGQVTQFDLHACEALEERARQEHWFVNKIRRP